MLQASNPLCLDVSPEQFLLLFFLEITDMIEDLTEHFFKKTRNTGLPKELPRCFGCQKVIMDEQLVRIYDIFTRSLVFGF